MAIQTGIGSWHREGFEHYVVKEVRSMLDYERKENDEKMNGMMNNVIKEMNSLQRRVDAVNGFYTWLIEVYPETVAQYKALMDLQKLGEKDE